MSVDSDLPTTKPEFIPAAQLSNEILSSEPMFSFLDSTPVPTGIGAEVVTNTSSNDDSFAFLEASGSSGALYNTGQQGTKLPTDMFQSMSFGVIDISLGASSAQTSQSTTGFAFLSDVPESNGMDRPHGLLSKLWVFKIPSIRVFPHRVFLINITATLSNPGSSSMFSFVTDTSSNDILSNCNATGIAASNNMVHRPTADPFAQIVDSYSAPLETYSTAPLETYGVGGSAQSSAPSTQSYQHNFKQQLDIGWPTNTTARNAGATSAYAAAKAAAVLAASAADSFAFLTEPASVNGGILVKPDPFASLGFM